MIGTILMAAALAAAAPDPALGLADTVALARANSLAAQVQRERLAGELIERKVLEAEAGPRLTWETQATYNKLPANSPLLAFASTAGGGGLVGFPAPGTIVDNTIAADIVVFDAFVLRDRLGLADLRETISELAVRQAEQDAMLQAAVSYFQVLRAEGLADVATQAVRQAQEHLTLGKSRLEAGAGTRAELLQLRAQVAQAQGQLIQAKNGVNIARLALANAVNAPVGQRPLQAAPKVPAVGGDVEHQLKAALDERPEVQQARLKQEADERRVGLEGRALWPQVTGISRYAQRGFYEGQFLAGFNLRWAAFDGFRTRTKMEAAQQAARVDRVQLEQARQGIALEVRQQAQNREDARARISTAREGLQASQEAYRIARTRFQEGLGSYIELVDAQGALTQARNTHLLAVDDQRVAELRLARALGRDLATFVEGK